MSDVLTALSKAAPVPLWRTVKALHLGEGGSSGTETSHIAEEVPIAFRYNGFSHAVMMATPDNLEDFATGFSLTEGAIASLDDIAHIRTHEAEDGIAVDVALAAGAFHRYLATRRVRAARGNTSCGLCGAEDLRDIRRSFGRLTPSSVGEIVNIEATLDALRGLQPLSRRTHGAHASAWVGCDGKIKLVREDIGRHNALDKLIGACLRARISADSGYCLITSRCSFEMVQKAVMAGYPVLISVAVPTALAIRTAEKEGLTLLSLDRGAGRYLYTTPEIVPQGGCAAGCIETT